MLNDPMPCVLILGMHRSGTSCLAGCLEAAGLYLGEVNNKAPFNTKGNKEDRRIMALHDAVLSRNGGAWNEVPSDVGWPDDLHAKLVEWNAALSAAGAIYGCKDPRTLLAINGWKNLPIRLVYVGTLRHPNAVAASLTSRNAMSVAEGWDLWFEYNRRLLKIWNEQPFPILNYDTDALLYRQCVVRVAGKLGLDHPNRAGEFYEASLRHHALDHGGLPPKIQELYLELLRVTVQQDS